VEDGAALSGEPVEHVSGEIGQWLFRHALILI
jgi:hypothetical protein